MILRHTCVLHDGVDEISRNARRSSRARLQFNRHVIDFTISLDRSVPIKAAIKESMCHKYIVQLPMLKNCIACTSRHTSILSLHACRLRAMRRWEGEGEETRSIEAQPWLYPIACVQHRIEDESRGFRYHREGFCNSPSATVQYSKRNCCI